MSLRAFEKVKEIHISMPAAVFLAEFLNVALALAFEKLPGPERFELCLPMPLYRGDGAAPEVPVTCQQATAANSHVGVWGFGCLGVARVCVCVCARACLCARECVGAWA